jgi:uncharacterized 2Fe-2S/4Fe-4S cluster protein (DUF4445 family)
MPRITVLPTGTALDVQPGTVLRDALQAARMHLDYPCGGKGTCRQCRVKVDPAPAEGAEGLKPEVREAGFRLACRLPVTQDCTVTIPATRFSRQAWKTGIRGQDVDVKLTEVSVRRLPISLAVPSLEDQRADWQRLAEALSEHGVSTTAANNGAFERTSLLLREGEWNIEAVCEEKELVCLRPRKGERLLGFAVDLGTTTVDLALVDLESGERIARSAFLNGQVSFGADVITRAQSFRDDRGPVREAAVRTIGEGALSMLQAAGLEPKNIVKTVVVGNPIMIHILNGIDPFQLTHVPYVPVTSASVRSSPRDFGWTFQLDGYVETLPLISAYVGADTIGMIVALDLEREKATTLSIDIGTNGEMVLARHGKMLATSTAAGPAFEGAQIACGMRALDGAITDVEITPEGRVTVQVVGGGAARGICGTGLIAGIAELLNRGVVDSTGRIVDPSEVPEPAVRERIFEIGTETAFALNEDRSVYLSQNDIRKLQLAKGAVRTGIETLLEHSGLAADELDSLRLAGNFGAGLDAASAMRIGLIPPMNLDKVQVVGNAALRGAIMVLLSRERWQSAQSASRATRFVELGATPEFQNKFMESMMF